jgi:hypothetical protein
MNDSAVTVKPSVKIRLSIYLTGPGKPRGLIGECFTLTDKPLSEACLSVIAVLRRYYLARLTADEVAAELQKAAEDLIRLICTGKRSEP